MLDSAMVYKSRQITKLKTSATLTTGLAEG
jgi:hypothetical protein